MHHRKAVWLQDNKLVKWPFLSDVSSVKIFTFEFFESMYLKIQEYNEPILLVSEYLIMYFFDILASHFHKCPSTLSMICNYS